MVTAEDDSLEGFMVGSDDRRMPLANIVKKNFIGAVRNGNEMTVRYKILDFISNIWKEGQITFNIDPANKTSLSYVRRWGAKV